MKTYEYKKLTYRVDVLQKALEDASFLVIGVVSRQSNPPKILVHLEDGETKDPGQIVTTHVDPGFLDVIPDKPAGLDGTPEAIANGVDKHTLTIIKKDFVSQTLTPGIETLQVIPSQMIQVSPSQPKLVNGFVTVQIGPSLLCGTIFLSIIDKGGKLKGKTVPVRFT